MTEIIFSPHPKPTPTEKPVRVFKPRKPLERRWVKPKARKPIKKRNAKRAAATFARCFGSVERVLHVQGMPCAACRVVGYSENAHLLGNDGARRRGHFTTIGPLCGDRFGVTGCHTLYDEHRDDFDAAYPDFNPKQVAADTDAACRRDLAGADR